MSYMKIFVYFGLLSCVAVIEVLLSYLNTEQCFQIILLDITTNIVCCNLSFFFSVSFKAERGAFLLDFVTVRE